MLYKYTATFLRQLRQLFSAVTYGNYGNFPPFREIACAVSLTHPILKSCRKKNCRTFCGRDTWSFSKGKTNHFEEGVRTMKAAVQRQVARSNRLPGRCTAQMFPFPGTVNVRRLPAIVEVSSSDAGKVNQEVKYYKSIGYRITEDTIDSTGSVYLVTLKRFDNASLVGEGAKKVQNLSQQTE